MNMGTTLQEARRLAPTATVLVQPVVPLLTRAVIGHAFIVAGLGKLGHFDATVSFFASLGIPAPELNAAFTLFHRPDPSSATFPTCRVR